MTAAPFRLDFRHLDPTRPVHLSGVAGSAMSGLADILAGRGLTVVGTDPRVDTVASRLAPLGVALFADQDGSRLRQGTQLLVATAAIPMEHPELKAAQHRGIPIVSYAEALGALMAEKVGVAVAGTHGKTTTTTMVVTILERAGQEPGFVIGAHVPHLGTSARDGQGPLFVAEACEYQRSFLCLTPKLAVITNIEADHLDYYGTVDNVEAAFAELVRRLPADGALAFAASCPRASRVAALARCDLLSYSSTTKARFSTQDVRSHPAGTDFTLMHNGHPVAQIQLPLPGPHNVDNALGAAAICHAAGLDFATIAAGLNAVAGAERRFEYLGTANGIDVVDDYAHHPSELRALLAACRQRFPAARLIIVFQPHQSSRTRLLFDEFATAFVGASLVLLPDIYSARDSEEDRRSVSAAALAAAITAHGVPAEHHPTFAAVVQRLRALTRPGDLVVTAGAGNVNEVAGQFLAQLFT